MRTLIHGGTVVTAAGRRRSNDLVAGKPTHLDMPFDAIRTADDSEAMTMSATAEVRGRVGAAIGVVLKP